MNQQFKIYAVQFLYYAVPTSIGTYVRPSTGLYSLSGDQLISLDYDQIRLLNKDLLVLQKGGDIIYYNLVDHRLIQDISVNE